ncbi:MAG TPA: sugar ABC transporter ATP-binding protein, partial [Fimbriimonadaceae bacterium]|nr:sugar ABC transporter ATP-binding protein [Fimbriimonadaceae bacterium]
LDVAENIFAGNLIRRAGLVDHATCRKKAGELLQTLGANIDPRTQTSTLSIAQKQLVELAAALAHEARVWIFDETTAPLTPKETEELFGVMRRLKGDGCAVVMVTHHLDEVFAVSDRVTVLRDGKVVAQRLTSDTDQQEVVRMMVGRNVEKHEHTGVQAGKTVLQTKSLTGDGFGNVDIEVKEGEVVGVAGLVGAGRTEFARAIFGIAPATSGSIEIDGKERTITSPRQARSLGIALVPEDRIHDGLLLPQSIAFNTTLASLAQVSARGFLKDREIKNTTEESATRLNLVHRDAEQPVEQLSGGNQQKVVLSKWLMTKPRLLILDEPTRGVDVGAKQEVHRIIRDLAASGLAVLMVSSDLPEVLSVSDRIVVMRGGEVVAELSPDDATEESVMVHATGGAPVA